MEQSPLVIGVRWQWTSITDPGQDKTASRATVRQCAPADREPSGCRRNSWPLACRPRSTVDVERPLSPGKWTAGVSPFPS